MSLKYITTSFSDLDLSVPKFVHPDITIREVAMLAQLDPTEYFERIDDIWTATVYPLDHKAICESLDRPAEELLSEDYNQQAFNFVFSATIGWAKKAIVSLAQLESTGLLKTHQQTGQVLPFVRH
jgi:hypothetical protein